MSKFDEKVEEYYDCLVNVCKVKADKDLLTKVTKGLGPSIYKADAALVSSSDKDELDRVKKNFLMKKLGLKDEAKMDAAIQKAIDTMGSSNRQKHRACFYYLLVKEMGAEKAYA